MSENKTIDIRDFFSSLGGNSSKNEKLKKQFVDKADELQKRYYECNSHGADVKCDSYPHWYIEIDNTTFEHKIWRCNIGKVEKIVEWGHFHKSKIPFCDYYETDGCFTVFDGWVRHEPAFGGPGHDYNWENMEVDSVDKLKKTAKNTHRGVFHDFETMKKEFDALKSERISMLNKRIEELNKQFLEEKQYGN